MYKIESGAPIPPRGNVKYGFHRMAVGDCIHVPLVDAKSARVAAIRFGNRHGAKFSSREDLDRGVVRIWRIA